MLFDPPILPTIVPRAVVLARAGRRRRAGGRGGARGFAQERSRRRWRARSGGGSSARRSTPTSRRARWSTRCGRSSAARPTSRGPPRREIGRRYVDVLTDNFGQPGFREVLLAVHDLDGRRDLVGAVLPPPARAAFEAAAPGRRPREAEIVDFTGPQRELARRLSCWAPCGCRSRRAPLVDRVSGRQLLARRAAPRCAIGRSSSIAAARRAGGRRRRAGDSGEPGGRRRPRRTACAPRPVDLRARVGEIVRSIETARARTTRWTVGRGRGSRACSSIRPDHNPIGPFDFGGDVRRGVGPAAHDRRADRSRATPTPIGTSSSRWSRPAIGRSN